MRYSLSLSPSSMTFYHFNVNRTGFNNIIEAIAQFDSLKRMDEIDLVQTFLFTADYYIDFKDIFAAW